MTPIREFIPEVSLNFDGQYKCDELRVHYPVWTVLVLGEIGFLVEYCPN